jgi:hypothetical protein
MIKRGEQLLHYKIDDVSNPFARYMLVEKYRASGWDVQYKVLQRWRDEERFDYLIFSVSPKMQDPVARTAYTRHAYTRNGVER